jgi:RNA polymerase sigma-70 factor (ECF subfamily)
MRVPLSICISYARASALDQSLRIWVGVIQTLLTCVSRFMMTTSTLLTFADGRGSVRPYCAGMQAAAWQVKGNGRVALDETDWSGLMLAVRDGRDRAAFAALFRHFAPRLKSYLMKSGANASKAEDCVQDVMATVWHKAAQFDPERAAVSTWVYTIARNRMIDMIRRERRPEPEAMPWNEEAEPDQADVYAAAEDSRLLSAALAELPEKQRSLIKRAFYGDLSHSEIALETGLPLGTIKSRIRLALDRLRAKMTES